MSLRISRSPSPEIDSILWSAGELDEALALLVRHGGLAGDVTCIPTPPTDAAEAEVERWLAVAVAPMELEAEAVDASYADAAEMLAGCAPALLRVRRGDGGVGFLLMIGGARGGVRVL
ncbi:MAG: hypothetical protein JO306_12155, partial [Gemmatimonadetes bacterium]|nr:hypothetical protein [Gemmatimonadota bacterium]